MPNIGQLHSDDPEWIGRYRIAGILGEGGQGIVYLADAPDGSPVAVKLLRIDWANAKRSKEQFIKEVAAARRVAVFCTARILDADLDARRPYIVSEYVEGPSLQQRVSRQGAVVGPALDRLAVGTITALAAIHQAGIVHRDFKPANVLMGPDGARVIDFGIARALDATATVTSRVLGTPAYMAPEQFTGAPVGTPVDVFAWGSTVAFAAQGRPPFDDDSVPRIMHRVLNEPPYLEGVPEGLRELVSRCLSKEPTDRPDAGAVLFRLLGRPGRAADAASLRDGSVPAGESGRAEPTVAPGGSVPAAPGSSVPAAPGSSVPAASGGFVPSAASGGFVPPASGGAEPGRPVGGRVAGADLPGGSVTVYPAAASGMVIESPTRIQPRPARRPVRVALTPRVGRRIAIVIGSGVALALVAVAAVSQGADAPPLQPDPTTSPAEVSLRTTLAVGVEMASAALSPDGRTAATVGRDNTFLLWDLVTGQRQGQFPTGNARTISKVVFGRDGRILATASGDAAVDGTSTAGDGVRLWSTSTRSQIAQASTGHASDVAFSPDGSVLAIADDGIRLWDVARGIQVGRLEAGDRMRAVNLAFSANGVLAVGEVSTVPDTDEVRLWDMSARRQIGRVLVKKAILAPGLAFSADGRRLASVDLDGSTARVWDVAQNRQFGDAVGRKDLPFLVALSSDGGVLAVAGGDSVRLYDVASGQQIKTLYATENVRGNRFSGLAFSPNGRELVVCGRGVQIWNVAALTASRSASTPTR